VLTEASAARPADVRGLCFRDESGRVVRTPAQKLIRDLDLVVSTKSTGTSRQGICVVMDMP